jgi:hypothetical protein
VECTQGRQNGARDSLRTMTFCWCFLDAEILVKTSKPLWSKRSDIHIPFDHPGGVAGYVSWFIRVDAHLYRQRFASTAAPFLLRWKQNF